MTIKRVQLRKAFHVLILSLAVLAGTAAAGHTALRTYAAPYIRRSWTDSSVSPEQFQRVIDILRTSADDDTGGQQTAMHDTGLIIGKGQDTYQFCYNMRELFLGKDDFGICFNEAGLSDMTAEIMESSISGMGIRFHATGTERGEATVFAGWLPGADPHESMRQHDAAMEVLQAVAAGAPQDDAEAYRYFFDWLCGQVEFDEGYRSTSHSAYSAVVEGCSVCEGYARSFEALCWLTGRYCRSVTIQGEGPYGLHERNIVYLNGEPKWVDVTWGDRPEGPAYEYLLYDVDMLWRQQLGL